jgi:hypothetical protein
VTRSAVPGRRVAVNAGVTCRPELPPCEAAPCVISGCGQLLAEVELVAHYEVTVAGPRFASMLGDPQPVCRRCASKVAFPPVAEGEALTVTISPLAGPSADVRGHRPRGAGRRAACRG